MAARELGGTCIPEREQTLTRRGGLPPTATDDPSIQHPAQMNKRGGAFVWMRNIQTPSAPPKRNTHQGAYGEHTIKTKAPKNISQKTLSHHPQTRYALQITPQRSTPHIWSTRHTSRRPHASWEGRVFQSGSTSKKPGAGPTTNCHGRTKPPAPCPNEYTWRRIHGDEEYTHPERATQIKHPPGSIRGAHK
jgi:hypothetical protein